MRLLNTETYEITEFFDDSIPEYAILSHTWGLEELTYQDIQSVELARRKKAQGFAKVEGACALANSEGFAYIWIDTCCIDKTSSAELSEAINSMYSWYRRSSICYAYLIDADHCFSPEFRGSRWFTRGWTLQELIAPSEVVFYSRRWRLLGRKSLLKGVISEITGIDISVLAGADPSLITVARKMSWASRRTTTRVEDTAYCLMGLFSVSMPLIYGEGKNAFFRLQEEIIKSVDDQSIFAWTVPELEHSDQRFYGLLAESPGAFKVTGKLVSPFATSHSSRHTTRVVNNSLQTEMLIQPQTLIQYVEDSADYRMTRGRHCLAALNCRFSFSGNVSPCIDLWSLDEDNSQFARINPWLLREVKLDSSAVSLRFEQRSASLTSSPQLWLYQIMTSVGQFFRDFEPWDFRLVTVSQKPRESIPIGFSLQLLSDEISTHEGVPVDRWYSNDRLLQRAYHSGYKSQEDIPIGITMAPANGKSRSRREDCITRVTEGVVRIGLSETRQRGSPDGAANHGVLQPLSRRNPAQFVALVLGVDIIYSQKTEDWQREPWCRLVALEEDMPLKDFQYRIDWKEEQRSEYICPLLDSSLVAKVVMLQGDKLYTVQLKYTHKSNSASWWMW
ncbi:het domain-containing [Trichoderma arundinaceum]|uniref:Het domain-containing n=1 Tax=Trichoderma arundinaceum TaxID=490622 RepID=A0A395NEU7_TRIAR|nr:het domain-containing [Trichoderma arundinaceum]